MLSLSLLKAESFSFNQLFWLKWIHFKQKKERYSHISISRGEILCLSFDPLLRVFFNNFGPWFCFKRHSFMRILDKQVWDAFNAQFKKEIKKEGYKTIPKMENASFSPPPLIKPPFHFSSFLFPDTSALCVSGSDSLNCIYYLQTVSILKFPPWGHVLTQS